MHNTIPWVPAPNSSRVTKTTIQVPAFSLIILWVLSTTMGRMEVEVPKEGRF
jgi:hypothetical protein